MTDEHKKKIAEGLARTRALKKATQNVDLLPGLVKEVDKPSEKPTDNDRLERMENNIAALADIVKRVVTEKEAIKPAQAINAPIAAPVAPVIQPVAKETPPSAAHMVPHAWRKAIDEALGKDFSVEVHDSAGGNFVIKIINPAKYDRRVGDEKNMMKYDCTVGLIRRASDLDDVMKWANLMKQTIVKKFPSFTPNANI